MLGFNVFVIFLLVLFISVVAAGVKVVPQGWNYTVERFGRYTRRSGLALPSSSRSSTASGGSSM